MSHLRQLDNWSASVDSIGEGNGPSPPPLCWLRMPWSARREPIEVSNGRGRPRNASAELVEDVWNGRRYDAAAKLIGGGYVNQFGDGPSARVEPIRSHHRAFPDLHLDIDELIVAGDTVVLRMTFPRNRHRWVCGPTPDRAGS